MSCQSHFHAIGFPLADIERLLLRSAQEGQAIESRHGMYVRWCPGAGAELWLKVDRQGQIVSADPCFSGRGQMPGIITGVVWDEQTPLDGSFHCWVGGDEDDPESGLYPVLINAPDFDVSRAGLTPPASASLQVAAFAHTLECYPDEETYYEDQRRRWGGERAAVTGEPFKGFAAESFIPSGVFDLSGSESEDEQPRAEGLFTGRVLIAESRTNPASGHEFHYLLVKTLGATLDVVADPAVGVSGDPIQGGVVRCQAWLSGRLTQVDRGVLGRLLQRVPGLKRRITGLRKRRQRSQ